MGFNLKVDLLIRIYAFSHLIHGFDIRFSICIHTFCDKNNINFKIFVVVNTHEKLRLIWGENVFAWFFLENDWIAIYLLHFFACFIWRFKYSFFVVFEFLISPWLFAAFLQSPPLCIGGAVLRGNLYNRQNDEWI